MTKEHDAYVIGINGRHKGQDTWRHRGKTQEKLGYNTDGHGLDIAYKGNTHEDR